MHAMDTSDQPETTHDESLDKRLARIAEAIQKLGEHDPADAVKPAADIADELGRLLEESAR